MRITLLIWIALIVTLSMAPVSWKGALGTIGRWHAAGHFGMFLILTLLATWKALTHSRRAVSAILALLFALTMELGETLIYRNRFEWNDVATDASAIAAGMVLLNVLKPLRAVHLKAPRRAV